MKKYFITGLVILLPLALTLIIISFIFNLLTEPFVGIFQGIITHFDLLDKGFLFLSSIDLQIFVSRILILLFLFIATVFLGWIARWVFFHYLLRIWDFILHRIPLVSSVYKTCQDVIGTIFKSNNQSFKQVVLVPYPNPETYCIGLVTRDHLPPIDHPSFKEAVAVFVPTTPNPTSGFLVLYKPEDLIYLDMKVEDAFKYVVSCGMVQSPFNAITREEALLLSQAKVVSEEPSA